MDNLVLIAVEDILAVEEEARVEILATNVINQVIGQVIVLKLLVEVVVIKAEEEVNHMEEVVNHMVVVDEAVEEAVKLAHNVIIVMKQVIIPVVALSHVNKEVEVVVAEEAIEEGFDKTQVVVI